MHCVRLRRWRKVQSMKRRSTSTSRVLQMICGLLIYLATPGRVTAEPQPTALSAFNSYVRAVESRLALAASVAASLSGAGGTRAAK